MQTLSETEEVVRFNLMYVRWCRFFSKFISFFLIFIGILVLLGWIFNNPILKGVLPGFATMKANTAFCFILLGISLATQNIKQPTGMIRFVGKAAAFLIFLISLLTFSQYLFGFDLKIDQLFFHDVFEVVHNLYPGRMAPVTAIVFIFFGFILCFLDRFLDQEPIQLLILVLIFLPFLGVIGYLYNVQFFYGLSFSYASMAFHTSVAFVLAGLGIICSRPESGIMQVVTSDTSGGVLVRRLLPAAVIIPLSLGYLRLLGERKGFYGTEFGVALFALSSVMIFTILIWRHAVLFFKVDQKRQRAEEKLAKAYSELEVRVQERTKELSKEVKEHQKAEKRLATQYLTSSVLNRSANISDALKDILKLICESLGWDEGALWFVDEKENLLRCAEVWHVKGVGFPEFEEITKKITFKMGEGLPGRIWKNSKPYWVEDVLKDPNFPRAPWAKKSDLHTACGFPIQIQGKTIAILEFFRQKISSPDFSLLQTFGTIGNHIGQFITRIESEMKLIQSNAEMKAILDGANYSIIATQLNGTIAAFNKGAERMLGYSSEEMVGKKTPELIHDREEVEKRAKSLSEELGREIQPGFEVFVAKAKLGEAEEREWSYIRKDGSRLPILLSVTPIYTVDKKITGFMGIAMDMTERKKIDQMKNEFLSTVSHELRTPLTAIRGSLGLMAEGLAGKITPEMEPLLQIGIKNCDRLIRLINDILDVEKIEAGKMAFHLKPLELLPLIQRSIEVNQGYTEQYKVRFILETPLSDIKVNVDEDRFIQIMTNLISNAAKFSPPGETVAIRMARHPPFVRISVIDHGPGVPKDFQNRLFEKFSQADGSDSRRQEGTGLGLSICKAFVEKMGGKINFESNEKGSTFYFDLPEVTSPQPSPS